MGLGGGGSTRSFFLELCRRSIKLEPCPFQARRSHSIVWGTPKTEKLVPTFQTVE